MAHLRAVIEEDSTILLQTNSGNEAILLSASKYNSMKETLYLLSSQANAESLYRAIAEIEQ